MGTTIETADSTLKSELKAVLAELGVGPPHKDHQKIAATNKIQTAITLGTAIVMLWGLFDFGYKARLKSEKHSTDILQAHKDITSQKAAHKALIANEKEYRAVQILRDDILLDSIEQIQTTQQVILENPTKRKRQRAAIAIEKTKEKTKEKRREIKAKTLEMINKLQ